MEFEIPRRIPKIKWKNTAHVCERLENSIHTKNYSSPWCYLQRIFWAKNAAHFYNSIKSERFSWVSTCFCSIRTLSFDVHINTKRRIQSIERKCCHQKSEACELMFLTQKNTLCRSLGKSSRRSMDTSIKEWIHFFWYVTLQLKPESHLGL